MGKLLDDEGFKLEETERIGGSPPWVSHERALIAVRKKGSIPAEVPAQVVLNCCIASEVP